MRHSEERIIGAFREVDAGILVKDLRRRHGFSEASYYLWRDKSGGTSASMAIRLKEFESENALLRTLLAESMFVMKVTRKVLQKNGAPPGAQSTGAANDRL